jgi:CheY-like chemotaxis protein
MVLFNLAVNARDAMPEGGTLTLSAAPEAIGPRHASGLPAGRYLRIVVRDTGTGMDAATLAHATEPFFTTKEVGQGTGLGLSMAHGFAERSGGRLAIASAPGQGTTVALLLPAAAAAAAEGEDGGGDEAGESAAEAESSGPPPADGSGLSLLLVDDAADGAREALGDELHAAGFQVARADTAAAALARLGGAERFDAVVIDLAAPHAEEAALATELARRHPGLPVLRIAANDDDRGLSPDGSAPVARQAAVRAALGLVRGRRRGAPPPANAAAATA